MTGSEIKAFRKRLGLSRRELADLLGLPNPAEGGKVTIARWENGEREPVPFLGRALSDVEREIVAGRR